MDVNYSLVVPDFATKDIAKRIGAKWSSLSESEKKA
jgi:hypothetical protein